MTIITLALLLFTGCEDEITGCEEEEQNQDVITENAMIYYYFDAGFGGSQCDFVVETENNKVYVPNLKFDLSNFKSDDGSNIVNSIKITYRLTSDKIDRCFHKKGFLEDPTIVIEIEMAEKL